MYKVSFERASRLSSTVTHRGIRTTDCSLEEIYAALKEKGFERNAEPWITIGEPMWTLWTKHEPYQLITVTVSKN